MHYFLLLFPFERQNFIFLQHLRLSAQPLDSFFLLFFASIKIKTHAFSTNSRSIFESSCNWYDCILFKIQIVMWSQHKSGYWETLGVKMELEKLIHNKMHPHWKRDFLCIKVKYRKNQTCDQINAFESSQVVGDSKISFNSLHSLCIFKVLLWIAQLKIFITFIASIKWINCVYIFARVWCSISLKLLLKSAELIPFFFNPFIPASLLLNHLT